MRETDINNLSRTDICLLLDFYGPLLTSHTRDVLDYHFAEDMSLSEIADHLDITRQAVHDRIRQGVASLSSFELKLGLVSRFSAQRACIDDAVKALDDGETSLVRLKLQQLVQLI